MPRVDIASPVYTTYEEAIAFGNDVLANYHPCGYGTSIGIKIDGTTKEDSTTFQIVGYRYDSCD